MSSVKRPLHALAGALHTHSPSQPASKRRKPSHPPAHASLDYLVDESARAGKKLAAIPTKGLPHSRASRVDESNAIVGHNDHEGLDEHQENAVAEIIDISSGEEDSSDSDNDMNDGVDVYMDDQAHGNQEEARSHRDVVDKSKSGIQTNSSSEDFANGASGAVEERDDEPTFGDLLHIRRAAPVDLQRSLQSKEHGLQMSNTATLGQDLSTGHSVGTLLSQALKSNDTDLLEICLAMNDQTSIRATVQRQSPREIALLLEKIAERVHRRPGRAGNLMTWVQWALICHGGSIAHQPELMKKLRVLATILRQRANGLQSLLHLKGKLDLLAAQLEVRRGLQQASHTRGLVDIHDDDQVLYIEGEDEESDDSEQEAPEAPSLQLDRPSRTGPADNTSNIAYNNFIPNGTINGAAEDESSLDGDEDEDEEDDDDLSGILVADGQNDSSDDEDSTDEELESEASLAENGASHRGDSGAGSMNGERANLSTLRRKR